MTIHVSLGSKNIKNLYSGFAKDVAKTGAKLLEPTLDSVTYSDGYQEEVFGFDIPVPALNQEFDLALIGKKGKWYDHKVRVSNPERVQKEAVAEEMKTDLQNGTYTIELECLGGSGKAEILSPAVLRADGDKIMAVVEWNSPNYDYMLVGGEKILPADTKGNSVFEIPVLTFDEPMEVIGDTVAMSRPHEIAYTLIFYSNTIQNVE